MVKTRSQKRPIDNEDLELKAEAPNIVLNKRRKCENGPPCDATTDSEESFTSATTTDCDTYETPSSSKGGSEKDDNEFIEDDSEEIDLRKIVSLTPDQLKNIVKESVKTVLGKKDEANPKQEKEKDIYDKFMDYVEQVHSGEFFERIPVEERKKILRKQVPEETILEYIDQLDNMRNVYKDTAPSIIDILNMNVNTPQKQALLEKVFTYINSEMLSSEYKSSLKYLLSNIKKTQDAELFKLEKEIIASAQAEELSDDYRKKILKSQMTFDNKVIAYKRLEVMERYEETDSSEFAKYKNWMDVLLSVPFGKYITSPSVNETSSDDISNYIKNVRNVLDKRLSFLEKPKDQIINIVTQMIRSSEVNINAIGLYGTRGIGKTSIVKSIAEAMGRPYRVISLGGESDASMLSGHNFTYVGSTPGRLIDILVQTKCMNPVILLDELDKISSTHHGKEIIGTLIHMTDASTNHKYNYDKYFAGIEFDLSKVLFVFTYNDPTKIDRILADRLFKIKIDNYTLNEKREITIKHIIPETLNMYNFTKDFSFSDDSIEYIVRMSKSDEGMRDIKRRIEIIISRINTLLLGGDVIKLGYKKLQSVYNSLPVVVQKEHVDILLSESSSNEMDDNKPPDTMYI